MKRWIKRIVFLVVVVGLGLGGTQWYLTRAGAQQVAYRTAPVKVGDLLATISATGTVEPEEVVDVGAQVQGQINSFGKDKDGKPIDYRSAVEKGTVLAQIDDSMYKSDEALAAAQVEQAKAGVLRAAADLKQSNAKLYQAQRDWERAQKLGPSEALAETNYDAFKAAYETAVANVALSEASLSQARASVDQAQAMLQKAQRNLSYCTITSPVEGVIIDRRVNIGQTVVSSLNAPSLFLIAKDLKRMQVWVSVNEADIGNIHPGQPVTFTVDAYPGQTFVGEVGKVRLNATMTQNVVTYTVEVITDNSSGRLQPYLTANVQFELSRRENVMLVPNAALRWAPPPETVPNQYRWALDVGTSRRGGGGDRSSDSASAASRPASSSGSPAGASGPGPSGWKGHRAATSPATASTSPATASTSPATASTSPARGPSTQSAERFHPGVVWVLSGTALQPVKVRAGLSDGTMTEVRGADLKEGIEVVVGEQRQGTSGGADSTNPFTPQLRPSNRSQPPRP